MLNIIYTYVRNYCNTLYMFIAIVLPYFSTYYLRAVEK